MRDTRCTEYIVYAINVGIISVTAKKRWLTDELKRFTLQQTLTSNVCAEYNGGDPLRELDVGVVKREILCLCLKVKCHQYWPNPDSATTYGNFTVTCHNEEGNSAFLVREMTLTHTQVTARTQSSTSTIIMSKGGLKKINPERKARARRGGQASREEGQSSQSQTDEAVRGQVLMMTRAG